MPELTAAGFVLAGQLALAGLTGLAIGIEREWSGHSSGPQARFGGVRKRRPAAATSRVAAAPV